MLDIKFIRENKDLVAEAARKKRSAFKVDELLSIDSERVKILTEVETLRAKQNKVSEQVAAGGADREALIEEMKSLKVELQAKEETLKDLVKNWQALMVQVPNVPDASVPEGDDVAGIVGADRRRHGDVGEDEVIALIVGEVVHGAVLQEAIRRRCRGGGSSCR